MKKHKVYCFYFLFLIAIQCINTKNILAQPYPVVINEVMVTPVGGIATNSLYDDGTQTGLGPLANAQWIELYNTNPCDTVDVSCWMLASDMSNASDTNNGNLRFPGGTFIPPLGYLIIGGNAVPNADFNVYTFIDTAHCLSSHWWLNSHAG
jgi:hypothetical protein